MKSEARSKQKIAVVTGGLGQLGSQFVSALVSQKVKVAILDCSKNIGGKIAKLVKDEDVMIFNCDIASRADVEKSLSSIINKFGQSPSILINNAAIDSPPGSVQGENGPFESYPVESLNRVMRVNVNGTFICCQIFGAAMAEQGWGRIINICSIYGLGSPVQDLYKYKNTDGNNWFKPAAYGVSKAAVINLTKYLATYWAKNGVCVNAISPAGIYNNQDDEFVEEYTKRIPIGRMAKESELNAAVLLLASEEASYITGANLVVDGGWTAW